MRALTTNEEKGSVAWAMRDVAEPSPATGEMLVRVVTAGLNRADLRLRADHYGDGREIVGGELAGVVLQVPSGCDRFSPGDRVMGLAPNAFAERVAVHPGLMLRVPDSIDFIEAAAVPAAYFTAHDALTRLGQLTFGQAVLIQGATSNVGIAAARLARYLGGRQIIAIGRSTEKLAALSRYFDVALPSDSDWPSKVVEATGGRGVDLVIDLVGGYTVNQHLACTALQGRIVAVGRLAGGQASIDLDALATRRLTLVGTTFRTRTLEERAAVVSAFERAVPELFGTDGIRPDIRAIYRPTEPDEAWQALASGNASGKIVFQFAQS